MAERRPVAGKGRRKESGPRIGGCEGSGSQTDSGEGETVLETELVRAEKVSVVKMKGGYVWREGILDDEKGDVRGSVNRRELCRASEREVPRGRGPRCLAGRPCHSQGSRWRRSGHLYPQLRSHRLCRLGPGS